MSFVIWYTIIVGFVAGLQMLMEIEKCFRSFAKLKPDAMVSAVIVLIFDIIGMIIVAWTIKVSFVIPTAAGPITSTLSFICSVWLSVKGRKIRKQVETRVQNIEKNWSESKLGRVLHWLAK